jgi:hypothetical protein
MLTDEQRSGAKQGLQALLELVATQQDVFSLVET